MTQEPAKPIRVTLSRKKGWRMPANTVKVCRPGRFGNPFKVGAEQFVAGGPPRIMTAETAVKRFKFWLENDLGAEEIRRWLPTLKGKNLACWCKPGTPCHADILLEISNKLTP